MITKVLFPVFSFFRLDGGAMFGSVPKNLWSRKLQSDEENCIPLVSRSMYIECGNKKILVDVGLGDKWNEKERKIFGVENLPADAHPFAPEDITDIVLTHLHFDHAGGISKFNAKNELVLTYPNATIHLQRSNLENAKAPNLRERASYLPQNVDPLSAATLNLCEGEQEILPGISVHPCHGHSLGQQWVEVKTSEALYMFATDLVPTAHHLPLPYTMGYDICAQTVLDDKERFLSKAMAEKAIVIFQHDRDTTGTTVTKAPNGHYCIDPEGVLLAQ